MKRKGRKPKTADNTANGVADREDQNGEASDREEQDSEEADDKKRRSNKRKSASKKVEEEAEEDAQNEDSDEPEDKKKKSGKRKSAKKVDEEEEEAYEVEQVLEEKMIQGVRHYLIRWKGYEPESDTWEPESTLNCQELIAEFKAKQKKKGKSKLGKKKDKNSKAPEKEETWDENEDFEVDRILDVYFKRNGQREFLVSWKGYPASQNSWEPEENMDCKDLIKKFMEKVEKAKEAGEKELRIKRTHTDRLTLMSGATSGRRLSKRNQGRQRIHYHDAE